MTSTANHIGHGGRRLAPLRHGGCLAGRWRSLATTGDQGSATIEAVIWTPVLVGILMFVVLCGRLVSAQLDLDAAAHNAARAASLSRDTSAATADARQAAMDTLADRDVTCPQPRITVDTAGLHPGGVVTVTVSCAVPLSDLGLIGVHGARIVTASALSPIDMWRGGP